MVKSNKVEILGVKVDNLILAEAQSLVEKFFAREGKYFIATPNPEMVVMAQSDLEFRKILNSADLSITDGIGLVWASKMLGKQNLRSRVTGIDLAQKLIKYCAENGLTVGFLGSRGNVAVKASECQKRMHQDLKVAFAIAGDPSKDADAKMQQAISDTAVQQTRKQIDLLLIAYGFPKQERWVARNLRHIPVKVALVVGGAFDVWAGKIARTPNIIGNLGLEWLWRLLLEPWRIKRQFALIKFVWLVIKERFKRF